MRLVFFIFILSGLQLLAQENSVDSLVLFESNFKLDSYALSSYEKSKIDSLFQKHPFSIIERLEIYGHTDSLADGDYNLKLSLRRVESILNYLVYIGLDPLKVVTNHYGEEKPKYNNSPATRFKNRRVELVLFINTSLLPDPESKLVDQKFKKGEKVRLPGLIFVGNQPIPMWESFSVMEQLLVVMNTYPDLQIELQGHVCCSNDKQLSIERAKMVYYYLVANGIDKSRMTYKGFSNSEPLYKEVDEETRKLNRRVEVFVKSNSETKVNVEKKKPKVELTTPVLNITFPQSSPRLTPSGDFMLGLVADMLKTSEGLTYEFIIYDNIGNSQLTKQRSDMINRTLRKKGAPYKLYKVSHKAAPDWMTKSVNENSVTLKIKEG